LSRLRNYYAALVGLLATLFVAGQITIGSMDISVTPLYVRLLTVAYVVAVICVPRIAARSPLQLTSVIVVGYLLARSYISVPGDWWSRDTTYLAVLEIVVASLAVLVAQRVALALHEFEDAVANITIGDAARIKPLDTAGDEIAVEMSRARRYERPLTVTIMSVEPASIQASLHRIVRDVQRAMMQRYILSGLARVAAQRTRRGDIVVQDATGNRIIIISPEASPEQVETLVHRLRDSAESTLGLPVRLGVAGFPHHALTFDDLVTSATVDSFGAVEADNEREMVAVQSHGSVEQSQIGTPSRGSSISYRGNDSSPSSTQALVSMPIDD
jgi:hypothetical protein